MTSRLRELKIYLLQAEDIPYLWELNQRIEKGEDRDTIFNQMWDMHSESFLRERRKKMRKRKKEKAEKAEDAGRLNDPDQV
jgi:hypothetical protein